MKDYKANFFVVLFTFFSTAIYANSTSPDEVNLNYKNSDGSLNLTATLDILKTLGQYCSVLPNKILLRTCQNSCESASKNVAAAYQRYTDAPNDTNNQVNLQRAIKLATPKGASCADIFFRLPIENGQIEPLKIYEATVGIGKLVQSDMWLAKKTDDLLDLGELTANKPKSNWEISKALSDINAAETLTFDKAIALIKQSPDYAEFENSAKTSKYTINQLTPVMNQLWAAKETSDRDTWRKKARKVGAEGLKLSLYSAIEGNCSAEYLKQHNQDSTWYNEATHESAVSPRHHLNKVHYWINPVYLHRLCAQQHFKKIQGEFDKALTRDSIATLKATYLSNPPVKQGANCKGCPPRRVMIEKFWIPTASVYLEQRESGFKKSDAKTKAVKDKQLAQQKVEQETANALANKKKDQETLDILLQFIDDDYPSLIHETARYTRPRNYSDTQWQKAKQDISNNSDYLFKMIQAGATFSKKMLETADKEYLLNKTVSLYSSSLERNKREKSNALITTSELFNNLMLSNNSRLQLIGLVSCIEAEPLVKAFNKNPKAASARSLSSMSQMANKCIQMTRTSGAGNNYQKQLHNELIIPIYKDSKKRQQAEWLLNNYQQLTLKQLSNAVNSGIIQNPRKNRYFQHQLSQILTKDGDLKLSRQYQRITGKSVEQVFELVNNMNQKGQQHLDELKRKVKDKPLPNAPYKFDNVEAYTILDFIKRNNWHCSEKNIEKIDDLNVFFNKLHACGYVSRDNNFKTFTQNYIKAYRKAKH